MEVTLVVMVELAEAEMVVLIIQLQQVEQMVFEEVLEAEAMFLVIMPQVVQV